MRSMALQLIRFCGVGVLCLGAATAGLAALHDLAGMYYLTAYAVAFGLGNLLGYILNGRFTFSSRTSVSGGTRYLILNTILLAINSLLMKILVEDAHIWYIGASLMLAVASTPISFFLHRTFSYSIRPSPLEPSAEQSNSAQ